MKEIESSDAEPELSPSDIDFDLLAARIRRLITQQRQRSQSAHDSSHASINTATNILESQLLSLKYHPSINLAFKNALKEAQYQVAQQGFENNVEAANIINESVSRVSNSTQGSQSTSPEAPSVTLMTDITTDHTDDNIIVPSSSTKDFNLNTQKNTVTSSPIAQSNATTKISAESILPPAQILIRSVTPDLPADAIAQPTKNAFTFNINDYLPRRQFRPRTLKQMKPYLVDRFEHQAQLSGDAKRALLIEKAAAEQDTDLLEQLQREDRMIREARMHKALQQEKRKDKVRKRSHIDNSVLGTDSESSDDNSDNDLSANAYDPDILDQLLSSSSSQSSMSELEERSRKAADIPTESLATTDYSSESDYSDNDTGDLTKDNGNSEQLNLLKEKLSKYRVLPKSYIRYLKSNEKKKQAALKKTNRNINEAPRKGLAIRKLVKPTLPNLRQGSLNFVDDISIEDSGTLPNPYQESQTDFDKIIARFRGQQADSSYDFDESEIQNEYESPNESDESLVETGYHKIASESLNEARNLSDNDSSTYTIESVPGDTMEIRNASQRLEDPLSSFNWDDNGDDDECQEDRRTGLDRMLNFGISARKPKTTIHASSTNKSNLSRKVYSTSSRKPNTSRTSSLSRVQSPNRVNLSSRNPKSVFKRSALLNTKQAKITSFTKTLRPLTVNRLTIHAFSDPKSHHTILAEGLKRKEGEELESKKKKSKKRKIYRHTKDEKSYEFYRNPYFHTLQLEGASGKYKKPKIKFVNQIFDQQNKNESNVYAMSAYEHIFNESPEALKIYPLKEVKFPENSLLNWISLDCSVALCDMFKSTIATTEFSVLSDIETLTLLAFSNALEYFKSKEHNADKLVQDLKEVSEKMAFVSEEQAMQLSSNIERFLENACNIMSTSIDLLKKTSHRGFNKFFYVILFFPILQLYVLLKASHGYSRSKLEKLSLKNIKHYFDLLVKGWSPRQLYNVLVDTTNNHSTVIYDVLFILQRILNSSQFPHTNFWSVVNKVLIENFKTSNVENLLSYLLVFSSIEQTELGFTMCRNNWSVIESAVQLINSSSYASEYELYRNHRAIFKTTAELIQNYEWADNNAPFKALVKLLKRRKFVNFANESLSFRIFDKLRFGDFRKSDTLCNYFIKLVMVSVEKSEKCGDTNKSFSKLAHFFEPNSNIFSDPIKPDVFLQTFINKINIYTLNAKISQVNYSNSVAKLVKSVIIQDDLACYEKAFEGLVCFYNIQRKSCHSKTVGHQLFEDLIVAFFLRFHKFLISNPDRSVANIKSERVHIKFCNTILDTLTELALSLDDLQASCGLYLSTFGSSKMFQLPYLSSFKYCDTLMRLLNNIIKSINRFFNRMKPIAIRSSASSEQRKQLGSLIKSTLWASMMNLIKLAASEGSFIPSTNYYCELVCCIANVSDFLVVLKSENWQSLNYEWSTYSVTKYHLVWKTQLLKYDGQNVMRHDCDNFIESFAACLVLYEPKEFAFNFFRHLLKNDYYSNEWLSFKSKFVSGVTALDFSYRRLELLSAFISTVFRVSKRDKLHESKALYFLKIMIAEFKAEYEVRRKRSNRENLSYYKFAKKVLTYLNFPSGRHLLQKLDDFYFLKQTFRLTSSITFDGPDLQKRIEQITDIGAGAYADNFSENANNKEEKALIFIQEQLLSALVESKQESFIEDLTASIINLQKDFTCEDEDALDATDSKLYLIIALIAAQVNLLQSAKGDIWIVLYYSLATLLNVIDNSGPFSSVDFWLLCRLVPQLDVLYGKPVSREATYYKVGSLHYIYTIVNDIYHLFAGHEEQLLFTNIVNTKTRLSDDAFLEEQQSPHNQYPNDSFRLLFAEEDGTTGGLGGLADTEIYKSIINSELISTLKKVINQRIKRVCSKNEKLINKDIAALEEIKSRLKLVRAKFKMLFEGSETNSAEEDALLVGDAVEQHQLLYDDYDTIL